MAENCLLLTRFDVWSSGTSSPRDLVLASRVGVVPAQFPLHFSSYDFVLHGVGSESKRLVFALLRVVVYLTKYACLRPTQSRFSKRHWSSLWRNTKNIPLHSLIPFIIIPINLEPEINHHYWPHLNTVDTTIIVNIDYIWHDKSSDSWRPTDFISYP